MSDYSQCGNLEICQSCIYKQQHEKERTFSARLKTLRTIKLGISQKDMATKLGIAQPTLSAYESGKISPNIESLINIADMCGVSVDYLLGRTDNMEDTVYEKN